MSQRASYKEGNSISASLLILVLLTSPLIFCHLNIPSVTLAEPIIFLSFFSLVLKNVKKGEFIIEIESIDIFLVLFLLFIALQLLFGKSIFTNDIRFGTIYEYRTEWGLIRVFAYVLLFWMIKNFINREREIRRLIFTAIITGTLLSVVSIFQRVMDPDINRYGLFTNRNHFAGYLGMILPLSISLLLYRSYKSVREEHGVIRRLGRFISSIIYNLEKGTFFFLISVLIMGFSIFMSASRGGITAFLVSIFFFCLWLFLRPVDISGAKAGPFGRNKFALILSLITIIIVVLALWVWLNPIIARFIYLPEELNRRLNSYLATIWLIKDYPFFGTGFNTFEYAFPRYNLNPSFKQWDYLDNEYLQFISEVGLVGTIILFVGIYLFLKKAFVVTMNTKDPFLKYLGYGCLAGIFFILIHNFVNFNLRIHSNALLFAAIMGILGNIITKSSLYTPKTISVHLSIFSKIIFYILIIFLVFGLVVISAFENAAFWLSKEDLNIINTASRLSPLNAEYHYLLSRKYMFKSYEEDRGSYLENALIQAQNAYTLNPLYHKYSLNLAQIHSLLGRYNEAEEYYQRYIELNPQNYYTYLYYAIYCFNRTASLKGVLDAQAFIKKGIVLYKKALGLYPSLDLEEYKKYITDYDGVKEIIKK